MASITGKRVVCRLASPGDKAVLIIILALTAAYLLAVAVVGIAVGRRLRKSHFG
jgi:hypothetical protein